MTGNAAAAGYRALWALPGIRPWVAVLVCQRFPVAMAPLALVYLGQAITGSAALGALLAGVHAVAEAVLAAPLGRRFDARGGRSRSAGRELALVLGAEAVLFAIAGFGAQVLPVAVVGAAVALGGGIAAGAHGGLRALAMRLAPPATAPALLAAESVASAAVWAASPALVAVLALLAGPLAPTLAIAVFAALGVVATRWLREPSRQETGAATTTPTRALWRLVLPAAGQSAALMLVFGGVSLTLPSLLPSIGVDADWTGGWLAVLTAGGILAGIGYGARTWRGSALLHCTVLLVLLSVLTAGLAVAALPVIAFGLAVLIGVLQEPAIMARSLAIQRAVPEQHWGMVFSATYGAAGLGYGAAGIAGAALIEWAGPGTALLTMAGLALVIAVVCAALERRVPQLELVSASSPASAAALPDSAA